MPRTYSMVGSSECPQVFMRKVENLGAYLLNSFHGLGATEPPKSNKKKKKESQLKLALEDQLEEIVESKDLVSELTAETGATVLDQVHQTMILFGANRGEALRRFLVDEGAGRNPIC